MRFFAILLAVIGLTGIAFNILMIPSLHFPHGADLGRTIGYYIGAFLSALIGLVFVIAGRILYKRATRRQRIKEARIFSLDFEQKRVKTS